MRIRAATVDDAANLTELMRSAKRSWGYPNEWMQVWEARLIIDADAIIAMRVCVAEEETGILGFYGLAGPGHTVQLEHLWVRPGQMGKGIGRALIVHAREAAASSGAEVIVIESDPHAEPFYRHIGAVRIGDIPAPAPGAPKRTLPLLELTIGPRSLSVRPKPAG